MKTIKPMKVANYYDINKIKKNENIKQIAIEDGELFDIELEILPKTLTHITLPNKFNRKINSLPVSLIELTFGSDYDTKIEKNILPESLKYLKFGRYYGENIEIDVLPKSLEKLLFGHWFNKILELGVFPNSLLYLEFGHCYNRILVPGVLPNSLKHLKFGYYYNQEIKTDVFPDSLIHLEFGYSFDRLLNEDILPKSLEKLILGSKYSKEINIFNTHKLKNLKNIILDCHIEQKNERKIVINNKYFKNNEYSNNIYINKGKIKKQLKIYSCRYNTDVINMIKIHSSKTLNINKIIKNKKM